MSAVRRQTSDVRAIIPDLGDEARAHRAAALADRKPQLLLHRDRRDQLDRHLRVVPRHHHLHPPRQLHRPPHVRRPQIKLRPIAFEKRRVPAPPPPPPPPPPPLQTPVPPGAPPP